MPAKLHFQWLEYRFLSVDEFKLSAAQLRILANYYFAKHGKIFKSKDLRRFFGGKWWYRPSSTFSTKRLSKADWDKVKRLRILARAR